MRVRRLSTTKRNKLRLVLNLLMTLILLLTLLFITLPVKVKTQNNMVCHPGMFEKSLIPQLVFRVLHLTLSCTTSFLNVVLARSNRRKSIKQSLQNKNNNNNRVLPLLVKVLLLIPSNLFQKSQKSKVKNRKSSRRKLGCCWKSKTRNLSKHCNVQKKLLAN